MDRLLLVSAAALAALALPAYAQARNLAGSGFPTVSGEPRTPDFRSAPGLCSGGGGLRHHRGGGCAGGGMVVDWYGGEWALYNNRAFEPDSYNGWWHDRPDRAFPRWVQEQRRGPCSEDRMWWSGSGWHC